MLAFSEATDIEQLTEEADRILDFPRVPSPATLSAQHPPYLCSPAVFSLPPSCPPDPVDPCDDPHELYRVGRHPQPTDCPHCHSLNGLCYFHQRFRSSARQSRPPCAWHPGNGQASLSAAGGSRSLLEVVDRHSNQVFLVDTGAEVSVLPASSASGLLNSPSSPTHLAVNSSSIATFGCVTHTMHFSDHLFSARFFLPYIQKPLLGADFWQEHRLLVDVSGDVLLLPGLHLPFPFAKSSQQSLALALVSTKHCIFHS